MSDRETSGSRIMRDFERAKAAPLEHLAAICAEFPDLSLRVAVAPGIAIVTGWKPQWGETRSHEFVFPELDAAARAEMDRMIAAHNAAVVPSDGVLPDS
jgi:hypothetical protein